MDKYIIWGLGSNGTIAYELLKDYVIVEAFVEQNPNLIGKTYKGIEIISFDDYLKRKEKLPLIITPARDSSNIIHLLASNNIYNYTILSDLLNFFYYDNALSINTDCFVKKEYKIIFESMINLYKELLTNYFCFSFLNQPISFNSKNRKIDYNKYNYPITLSQTESITRLHKIIFNGKLQIIKDTQLPKEADLLVLHGINLKGQHLAIQAATRKIPILFAEDGFIRSIVPLSVKNVDLIYNQSHSTILDDKGIYINAFGTSNIEMILNSDIKLSNEQILRTKNIIKLIKDNKISKYNHQPILNLDIGNPKHKKVLVIDQVYNDKSIKLGWANEKVFKDMLLAAINENPGADILVKTHPDKRDNCIRGYLTDVEPKDNVYKVDFAINPISMLEQVDKVYVCTSQMGFEALMCGKEVHIFGMPFYAGWGVTNDRQTNPRRIKKRSLEEIFYAAYIMCTKYVSYKTNSVCEIEQTIEEILELRKKYWTEQG